MKDMKDSIELEDIEKGLVERKNIQEERTTNKLKKFNHCSLKPILLCFFWTIIISLISFYLGAYINKSDISEQKDQSNKSDQSINKDDKSENFEKIHLPFALQLRNNDSPEKLYSAIEKSSAKVVEILNKIDIVGKTYTFSMERNLDISMGISSSGSSEIGKHLLSSIISVEHFENSIKEVVQKKIYKGFVSIKIERARIYIESGKIKLGQFYTEQITDILNSTASHNIKATKLYDTFQNLGYFIPLQVVLGGRIDLLFEEESEASANKLVAELKADSKIISKNLNNTYDRENGDYAYQRNIDIKTLGGEISDITEINSIEGLKKWYNSLIIDNYNIIGYENIVPITRFFPPKIKKLYEEFEEDISNKFNDIYDKYQILKYASSKKVLSSGENGEEWSCGAQKNDKQIQTLSKEIEKQSSWWHATEVNFVHTFGINKYVVGFKIINRPGKSNDGKWELLGENETIIRNSINIKFTSEKGYKQDWSIEVYYVDFSL